MLILLSPAKTLDFESPLGATRGTKPALLDDTQQLVDVLRPKSVGQVKKLMGVSDKLAAVNHQRFQDFQSAHTAKNARPAALAFMGDVYEGMEARTFDAADLDYAQLHLRILSGLYGCLRPLDRIQPYRLEMGTRLANPRGADLYAFWQDRVADAINKALKKQGDDVLVNLASNEYFKAANPGAQHLSSDPKPLRARVVTPAFKEERNGKLRVLSFFAKKARGAMAGWIIRQRVDDVKDLQHFDLDGYRFNPDHSRGDDLVFSR
ncbi:MAG: peroxide stress protein YaaA [Planctomycetota bacterium]|jgi:cytoplasmic iron level regulating protein YaaA (DUF328/UPF0246 family)